MVTSGFHLWQFQVFNSGAEGSLVVLFWLLRDFLYLQMWVKNGDLWICSPALYHYIWWLLVFTSDNLRNITQGQRDWWWYCSHMTCERFSFCFTGVSTGNLWIYSPALYHYSTVTFGFHLLQFEVFNSGAEGLVVVFFWLDLWEIFFFPALGFELGTSGSWFLHSSTAPCDFWFSPMTIWYLPLV